MKQGKCTKCGKEGKVFMHHTKGYEGENKDFVLPYCMSCHKKIHYEARKTGRCKIPVNELKKLSARSVNRRLSKENCMHIDFYETMMPNVAFLEVIDVWPNNVYYKSRFRAKNGKELYEIMEA